MKNDNNSPKLDDQVLVNDRWVARFTSMSLPWVRQQRYRKARGLPHYFTVEPVYLGNSPRYRKSDVLQWLNSLLADK